MHVKFKILFRSFICVIGITANSFFGLIFSQPPLPDTLSDRVYKESIHTVLLRSATWEFSAPLITLASDQKLELRFDDFSNENRVLTYTLIHCDADWRPSSLSLSEYLSGYGIGTIDDYVPSVNTTWEYLHYHLEFPEEECLPILSGNYAIVVYDENNPENILLTRRFYIAESAVQINAGIKQPTGADSETGQQIFFSVMYNSSLITDPLNELSVIALQNNRFDRQISFKRPFTMQPGRLDYNNLEGQIFDGGNEFRTLDIKSIRYQTENLAAIKFENNHYHAYMKTDQARSDKPYFSKTDLNGNFFIEREKSNDKHLDADYLYVHFNFESPFVVPEEKVFVMGGFTGWASENKYRMNYNAENSRFELSLLLKQGYYDYCFAMKNSASGKINELDIEGNYYETKNDYMIFVYFHDKQKRADRLLGYLPIKQ